MPEEMISDYKVEVKKDNFLATFKTCDIVQFNESYDGINFQLKNGIAVHFDDQFMPIGVKIKIKSVLDTFKNGNVKINMNDYNNPISVFQ